MSKKSKLKEDHQSSDMEQNSQQDSSKQSSTKKRKSTISTNVEAKRIRSDDDVKSLKNTGTDSIPSKKNRYTKGGLVYSLHGDIYQLKLQMLFLKRAIDNYDKGYEFYLGTEVKDAERFDDIVFKYKNKDKSGKYQICFLQAKHKQDKTQEITYNLLKAKDGDFNLQKYFISYRKIMQNTAFNECELKDFILCTNMNFKFEDLNTNGIKTEEIKENDDILSLTSKKIKIAAARYKLIVEDKHELYKTLKKASDLHILAEALKQRILKNTKIDLRTEIFQLYHVPLNKEVFTTVTENKQEKKVKFSDNFLKGEAPSNEVNNFREALKSAFKSALDKNKDFQTYLKEKELSVSLKFGVGFELESNPNITDPKALAKEIAKTIHKAAGDTITICRKPKSIENNINMLAGHILVQDDGTEDKGNSLNLIRFREEFFDDDYTLAGNLGNFRTELKNLTDFNKVKQYKYKINEFNTCKETSGGNLLYSKNKLPNDKIEDKEIKNFFKKLVFAVNQPNEEDLGKIIEEKLGEDNQFNLLNADLVADSFQRKMLDWFKAKGKEKGKEGVFLNKKDGKAFFEEIGQKVNTLISVGLNLAYSEELQAYGIQFEKNYIFDQLKNFLSENTIPVFHLMTSEETILSAVNVCSALEYLKQQDDFLQYRRCDSYIFMHLSILLRPKTKERVMNSFQSKDSHNLLIIDCKSGATKDEIKGLHDELLNNLSKNKKIILIAKKDNTLAKQFPDNLKQELEESTSFSDLTEKSKENLLNKKVTFQGEEISLKHLYFELQDNAPSSEQLNQLNIDAEAILELIKNDKIKIGSRPFGRSDLEGAYSRFYEKVNNNVLIEKLEESNDKLFVISGIGESDKKNNLIKKIILNKEQFSINQDEINNSHTQGNKKITLADSEFKEKNFKELCHNNPDKNFYWINWKNNEFILSSIYYPKFLERKFQCPKKIVIKNEITTEFKSNDKSSDDVFFFTGVNDIPELASVLNVDKDELKNKRNIIIEKKCEKDFDTLVYAKYQYNNNKPVHWLDVEKNNGRKIIWCKSHGPLTNLRDYIDYIDIEKSKYKDIDDSEEDLIDTIKTDKASIIIDKPGMGKSTTLAILSEKMLKSHWVIFITLRDWPEAIGNLPDNIDTNAVVNFLSDTKNLSATLEKNLAKYILEHQCVGKPLLLLFDGFDEIRSYTPNKGKIKMEGLLMFLKKNTQSTICITAREHNANRLQDTLSVFNIRLNPLEENQIKDYFHNVWKSSLALSVNTDKLDKIFANNNDSKFQKYYKKLSAAADEAVNNFIDIPLSLRLFTESFRSKFKEFIDSDENFFRDFNGLSISSLYQDFIDEKFKIFIGEKTNLSSEFTSISESWFKEKVIKLHYRFAFKELFDLEKTKELLGNKQPFKGNDVNSNAQLEELLSVGIIRSTRENHYEFLHRNFIDYFSAQLFINWIENPINWMEKPVSPNKRDLLLITDILLKPDYELIRTFMNSKLNEIKVQEETKERYRKISDELWKETKYKGKTILHVTAEEDQKAIIYLLLNIFAENDMLMQALLEMRDDKHETVLYMAVKNKNDEVIEKLLNIVNNYNNDIQEKILLATMFAKKQYEKDESIIYLSRKLKDTDLKSLKQSYENLALESKWKLIKKFLHKDENKTWKQSAKRILDRESNENIQYYLINSVTKKGNNILHKAVRSGDLNEVKELFSYIKPVAGEEKTDELLHALNYQDRNILHKAARSGSETLVEWLVKKKVNVNAEDNWGNTPLRDAIRSGNVDLSTLLVSEAKSDGWDVNAKDQMNHTPLKDAVTLCHFNMIKFLVKEGAKVNADVLKLANDLSNKSEHIKSEHIKKLVADDKTTRGDFKEIIDFLETENAKQEEKSESSASTSGNQSGSM